MPFVNESPLKRKLFMVASVKIAPPNAGVLNVPGIGI